MKIKDKVKVGEWVELYYPNGAFGYFDTPNFYGVVAKVKGLNGSSAELTFDDGSRCYITHTTKVKR